MYYIWLKSKTIILIIFMNYCKFFMFFSEKKTITCIKMIKLSFIICMLFIVQSVFAQGFTVSGTVSSSEGETMPGVNVVIKGSLTGVITDIDGKYSIVAPGPDAILVFSFVGYAGQESLVGNQRIINITLAEETQEIEEIVVVGYGTARRRDITGAVTSVSEEALMAKAPTSIEEALQGQVAGVIIAQSSQFGATPTIRVRGNRSIGANNDPLFVVDGVPIWGNMENINPNDIQSIEILKDASATAIYGVRGANGVVLVTTKKGEQGRVQVDYQGFATIGKIDHRRFRRVFDAAEYVEYARESSRTYLYDGEGGYTLNPAARYKSEYADYESDKNVVYFTNDASGYVWHSLDLAWNDDGTVYDPSKLRGFNWQTSGYRDASYTQSHSVSVRAGSQNTRVLISGSYLDMKGITLKSTNTRYTLRLNLDQTVGKHFSTGANINFSHMNNYNGMTISTSFNPLGNPYYSPGGSGQVGVGGDWTQTGDPALGLIPHPAGETLAFNPFYNIDGTRNENKRSRLSSSVYAQFNIIEGLTFRMNFGSDLNVGQNRGWASYYSTTTGMSDPRANQDLSFNRDWTLENILTYKKTLSQNHSFDITAVQSSSKRILEPVTASVLGLVDETQLWYDLGNATSFAVTSDYTQTSLLSWMGRINYSYKGTYVVTATARWDGASQLAKGNKWATFPAVSVAWRISDEQFMKGVTAVQNLKMRAGYGVTGQSSVRPYSTVGQTTPSRYTWGKSDPVTGLAPSSLSSPALGWEYTAQWNIGIDASFLKGRLSAVVELYKQNTTDLLMLRTLPRVTGFTSIYENIGETENKGIEIGINSINIQTKKIRWSTNLQIAANKEQITKLDFTNKPMDIANNWFVGKPIDTYYWWDHGPSKIWSHSKEDMDEIAKFKAAGNNFAPGDIRPKDQDGDYRITEADRTFLGQKMPKWTFSMSNNFTYGAFDLYVFMHAMTGQRIFWDPGTSAAGRYNSIKNNYWTPRNPTGTYIKPIAGLEQPENREILYYHPGSFLKISDITLGYTLPKNLVNKVNISDARIYLKVRNPFLFTKFEGNDPEGSVAARRTGTQGATLSRYGSGNEAGNDAAMLVYYQLGLNITFK